MATISTNNQPTVIQIQYELLIEVANLCKAIYAKVVEEAEAEPESDRTAHLQYIVEGIEIVFNNIVQNIQEIAEREGLELPMVRDDVAEPDSDVPNMQSDVEQQQ